METKINIAEILKDKPQGIRLYSPIFGECAFCFVREDTEDICVKKHNGEKAYFNSEGLYDALGEVTLFPSKELCDWLKFTWKKGDVLQHAEYPLTVIFESFEDDIYTSFKCKYCFNFESASKWLVSNSQCSTKHFYKVSDEEAKEFIKKVELNYNGKLKMETLEIEPAQPEFKDGDIITIKPYIGGKLIYLFKAEDEEKYYGHAFLNGNITIVYENNYCQKDFCTARLSTEKEKQQLFSALAKKGKAWDSEKKQVVDLKPKCELKPFDKVLVKDNPYGSWGLALFWKRVDAKDLHPYMVIGGKRYRFCEPYEGNEHFLND